MRDREHLGTAEPSRCAEVGAGTRKGSAFDSFFANIDPFDGSRYGVALLRFIENKRLYLICYSISHTGRKN